MGATLVDVETASLVVDIDTLERNITGAATFAHGVGISMRPHAKTHKTVEVAQRQLQAGASGLSVATLGEAEVFAEAGFGDLFIAFPLWLDSHRQRRFAELSERVTLRVGIDSSEAAPGIARASRNKPQVLIEIDCGHHRSGVLPAAAAAVANATARAGLEVLGIFTFPGQSYEPGFVARAAGQEAIALERAAIALEAAGHQVRVRSGGSTPTFRHTKDGIVTELRPGVYVFNDAQQVALGSCKVDDVALCAYATVVSVSAADRFVLDIGSKVLGADRPPWVPGYGLLPDMLDARVLQLSEHHAVVTHGEHQSAPKLGEVVRVIPNHVCSAVNLVDKLILSREGTTQGHWAVFGRGRNS